MPRTRHRRLPETLRLELNMARAPIWAPRAGLPVQLALDWAEVPFYNEPFLIRQLAGALSPIDLLVTTHICDRYLVTRPADLRVSVSLGEVATWTGAVRIGGEQRRLARESLERLRASSFTSRLQVGGRGDWGDYIKGWGIVDEWVMPAAGNRQGFVRLSRVLAQLLDANSVVLLDRVTLEGLVRTSPLAARLWVWLEGEGLAQPRLYGLFAGPEGEPARARRMPAIADLLRLSDQRRRNVAARIRLACQTIEAADARYRLDVAGARERGMWNLSALRLAVAMPRDIPDATASAAQYDVTRNAVRNGDHANRASGMTHEGVRDDANRASGVTHEGVPDDAAPEYGPRSERAASVLRNRASGMTRAVPLRRSSSVVTSPSGDSVVTRARNEDDERRRERMRAIVADGSLPIEVRRRYARDYDLEVPA